MKIIDSHLHLFDLQRGQYHWLKSGNPPFWSDKKVIQHNFSEQDLILNHSDSYNHRHNHNIAAFIHVEAGFNNLDPSAEIKWLLSTVKRPFKAVAGIDLTLEPSAFIALIDELITLNCVCGVRHILDEDAVQVLSLPQVTTNLIYLAQHNLSFDLQMPIADTLAFQQLLTVLTSCPTLKVILNHAGWPPVDVVVSEVEAKTGAETKEELMQSPWYTSLQQLAALPQCAVKCSGWEMLDRQYKTTALSQDDVQKANLQPDTWKANVLSLCLQAFGKDRVMIGSNFPLCLFHSSYQDYWDNIFNTLTVLGLSEQKKQAIVFNNACFWYQLNI